MVQRVEKEREALLRDEAMEDLEASQRNGAAVTSPVSQHETKKLWKIIAAVGLWWTVSISLIMMNKWLLSYYGFSFPIALTMTHQLVSAILAFFTVRVLKLVEAPTLSREQVTAKVLPVAIMFSFSIALSNGAALRLTVPFMQMLKAATPTISVLIAFCLGTEKPSLRLFLTILWIGLGVMIASFGELEFNMFGTILAVAGLSCESLRLVLSQRLLQADDIRFNAITGVYFTAPLSFVVLFALFLCFEYSSLEAFVVSHVNPTEVLLVLLSNGVMAFFLNLSVYQVLQLTSAITYGVMGQMKDWVNMLVAIPVFNNTVTGIQVAGYSLAVSGVFYYKRLRQGGK
mmetsp:Transcript_11793/g.43090  ORF Transcript_11793/g.43090 Transcript_11793/m.43090 type:complete len:344 (-) Transcript_11793:362-1393(-)